MFRRTLFVECRDGIDVVRDDILPGGTKRRALTPLLASLMEHGWTEFVFGGPAEGYAQLALAWSARDVDVDATYFVAKRKRRHRHTEEAAELGCRIIEVQHGRLNVVQARARAYCERNDAYFLPLGFDTPEYERLMVDEVVRLCEGHRPSETWAVAGSGLLTRCLQQAFPDIPHNAVRIGFEPQVGNARLFVAPEAFGDEAQEPPPFPSCTNYDAKAWRFIREHAQPGALFWNVGR